MSIANGDEIESVPMTCSEILKQAITNASDLDEYEVLEKYQRMNALVESVTATITKKQATKNVEIVPRKQRIAEPPAISAAEREKMFRMIVPKNPALDNLTEEQLKDLYFAEKNALLTRLINKEIDRHQFNVALANSKYAIRANERHSQNLELFKAKSKALRSTTTPSPRFTPYGR
jgi:hypothetical protein